MNSDKKLLMIRKQLILILLALILLIPAIHKILDQIPPDWFIQKFNDSFIGKIPGCISISYYLIILLEFTGPILFLIGLIQMNRKKKHEQFLSLGFLTCYLLFLTLTFGSFLVQDYDNGFKDFMYFISLMLIEYFFFSSNEKGITSYKK
jgi:uncharacterized membrane protein YphA (DoxX/SURF4 family)